MLFKQIRNAPTGTYAYLLADHDHRIGVVVDPVVDSRDVLLALIGDLGLDLRYILLTHLHRDTGRSAAALRDRTGSAIVASVACGNPVVDVPVDHGDRLGFGDEAIDVIGTPGHTPCSISFCCRDRLFTGDTLLLGSCGDTAQPDADPGRLFDSVTGCLFALPPETLVFPGFDAAGRTVSTIAEERATNPRFAGRSREAFVTLMSGKAIS
jgi:glyoxylase-like metal-dependent hydrolase (beta-lactamase superfamily II)